MANRNKTAGSAFEYEIRDMLQEMFPERELITTRLGSKQQDSDGIDIMDKNERVNGLFPIGAQCKNTVTSVNYHGIMKAMVKVKGVVNILFSRRTEKSEGGRFIKKGQYMILDYEDGVRFLRATLLWTELLNFKYSKESTKEKLLDKLNQLELKYDKHA